MKNLLKLRQKSLVIQLAVILLLSNLNSRAQTCTFTNSNWLVHNAAGIPTTANWATTNNTNFVNAAASTQDLVPSIPSQVAFHNVPARYPGVTANNLIWNNALGFAQNVVFKNTITAGACDSIVIRVTSDDRVNNVWFNGTSILAAPATGWQLITTIVVPTNLITPGTNYICIQASDISNSAAWLLGQVCIYPKSCCDQQCFWTLDGNSISNNRNLFGTTSNNAVRFITNNTERGVLMHSGIFGFGTMNPTWNFRATIDNRDINSEIPNTRNGLHVIALQPAPCSFGNGIRVQTNSFAATKALAIDGNNTDRAIIFGNGMSWFKNRMQLGGTSPTFQVCDDNSSGHMLVINGTGLVNGMFINSDKRFKKNIKGIENANDIIRKMNPVIYDLDTKQFAERNFDNKPNYGFIAQELNEIVPNIVNLENDKFYSVNYIQIIPILTQALKEQQMQIEELKNLISTNSTTKSISTSQEIEVNNLKEGLVLSQNVPNPFTNDTRISYSIPQAYKIAKLGVYDLNGQELKLINLTSAVGEVTIQGGNLKPGMYLYSLILDGNTMATKRMTLTSK